MRSINPPQPLAQPWWQTTRCPTWCEAGDIHARQHHPDDRLHYGPADDVAIPLSLSAPSIWSTDDVRPPALTAVLEQVDGHTAPILAVAAADGALVKLTLPELRAWMAYLRRLLALADPCEACDAGRACGPHREQRRQVEAVGAWANGRADAPAPMATVPAPRAEVA